MKQAGSDRLLFLIDPPSKLNPRTDTTIALMEAAIRRGLSAYWCEIVDLEARNHLPFARAKRAVTGTAKTLSFEAHTLSETLPLEAFRLVFMRKDPPVSTDYLYATQILELAGGTKVINAPEGLRAANEKLLVLRFPALTPQTFVSRKTEALKAFLKEQGGRMVVKPLWGAGGERVFLVREDDPNKSTILETITEHETRLAMAQAYIPEVTRGDKRILLWKGEPVGAVLRIPRQGELRGNLHVGADSAMASLTSRDLMICEALKPALVSMGLFFVGIDVIGPYLTEVNVTSPTGVREYNALHKAALEEEILERALKEC